MVVYDEAASVGGTADWIQLLLQERPAAAGVTLTGNMVTHRKEHVHPSSSSLQPPSSGPYWENLLGNS